jgi:acetyl-CoA C-acetyltransferase
MFRAAVERVPEIKPEQVEEVFFGNVLSAKYVIMANVKRN